MRVKQQINESSKKKKIETKPKMRDNNHLVIELMSPVTMCPDSMQFA